MKLAGSCECQKVKFTVESETPVPFMYCFCSICRKTSGAAFGCNVMGLRRTLKVSGQSHVALHRARIRRKGQPPERSMGERYFCSHCGSHLYLLDRRWPDHVWPNAGAIDSDLPSAPEQVFMMVAHKPTWVPDQILQNGPRYNEYPPLSIQSWHEGHGLLSSASLGSGSAAAKRPARKRARTAKTTKTTKKRAARRSG